MFSWRRLLLIFVAVAFVALFYPFAATDAQRRASELGYHAVVTAKLSDKSFVIRTVLAAALLAFVAEILMAPIFRNISKRGRGWKTPK